MAVRFEVATTATSQLWDFGWFDLTRFRVEDPTGASNDWREPIRLFFGDPISQRTFCTLPDPWGAACGHHGPFLSDKLDVAWLEPIPSGDLPARLVAAYTRTPFAEPPSEAQRRLVLDWANEVQAGGALVAELMAPPDLGIRVPWANMVWMVYREYLCVSRDGREVSVAVIGYD